jgi:hypothetical protein
MSAFMTSEEFAGKWDRKGTKQPTQARGVGNKKQAARV